MTKKLKKSILTTGGQMPHKLDVQGLYFVPTPVVDRQAVEHISNDSHILDQEEKRGVVRKIQKLKNMTLELLEQKLTRLLTANSQEARKEREKIKPKELVDIAVLLQQMQLSLLKRYVVVLSLDDKKSKEVLDILEENKRLLQQAIENGADNEIIEKAADNILKIQDSLQEKEIDLDK